VGQIEMELVGSDCMGINIFSLLSLDSAGNYNKLPKESLSLEFYLK